MIEQQGTRIFDRSVLYNQLYFFMYLGMFIKNLQAYLYLFVVWMVILEHLPVENIWNLSIFIKGLIKSHPCSLVLKISFLKNFLPRIIFSIFLYAVCLHDLILCLLVYFFYLHSLVNLLSMASLLYSDGK